MAANGRCDSEPATLRKLPSERKKATCKRKYTIATVHTRISHEIQDHGITVSEHLPRVAKVTRDRLMRRLHDRDPRYGFDRHKGYATRDHLDAVSRFGYSEIHRRSFRPPSLFDKI